MAEYLCSLDFIRLISYSGMQYTLTRTYPLPTHYWTSVCLHMLMCAHTTAHALYGSKSNFRRKPRLNTAKQSRPKELKFYSALALTANSVPDRLIRLGSLRLSIKRTHYGESGWNAQYQCLLTLLIGGSGERS